MTLIRPDQVQPSDTEDDVMTTVGGKAVWAAPSGSSLTIEEVQDLIAAMIAEGTGLTAVYDDGAGTYTISVDTASETERVVDAIATALDEGANITIVYDDVAGTITIAATGGGGSGGHIIEKADGTDMTARGNLQFVGATVTDDSGNDRTVVTVDGLPAILSNQGPWDSGTAYAEGDIVQHNGSTWNATGVTTGDEPGADLIDVGSSNGTTEGTSFGAETSTPFTVNTETTVVAVKITKAGASNMTPGKRIGLTDEDTLTKTIDSVTFLGVGTIGAGEVTGTVTIEFDAPVLLETGVTYRLVCEEKFVDYTNVSTVTGIVATTSVCKYASIMGTEFNDTPPGSSRLRFTLVSLDPASPWQLLAGSGVSSIPNDLEVDSILADDAQFDHLGIGVAPGTTTYERLKIQNNDDASLVAITMKTRHAGSGSAGDSLDVNFEGAIVVKHHKEYSLTPGYGGTCQWYTLAGSEGSIWGNNSYEGNTATPSYAPGETEKASGYNRWENGPLWPRSEVGRVNNQGDWMFGIIEDRKITASQSGTTVTKTAGTSFTAGDVGKWIYWGDRPAYGGGTRSVADRITAYTDATHVTVETSRTIASQAARIGEPKVLIDHNGNLHVTGDLTVDGSTPGGGGGHIIEDDTGTDMTARSNLQFLGADVTDDAGNDRTIVEFTPGGSVSLDDLTDVDLTGEANGDFLSRVGGVWVPVDAPSGGSSAFLAIAELYSGTTGTLTQGATKQAIDATNLILNFTYPASGAVMIEFSGLFARSSTRETYFYLATAAAPTTALKYMAYRNVSHAANEYINLRSRLTGTPGAAASIIIGWESGSGAGNNTLSHGQNGQGPITFTAIPA